MSILFQSVKKQNLQSVYNIVVAIHILFSVKKHCSNICFSPMLWSDQLMKNVASKSFELYRSFLKSY